MADTLAALAEALRCGADGAVRGTPSQNQEVALGVAPHLGGGNVARNARHLLGAQQVHAVMVVWVVADGAELIQLLQTTNTMLKTLRPRNRPRTRECLRVALIWTEAATI